MDAAATSVLFSRVRAGVLGRDATFATPFSEATRVVYADWTASSRAHAVVERTVTQDVLPYYGNTHDHHSQCGHQSTAFREEARQIVAQACNAKTSIGDNDGGTSKDVVIFAGAGATGATNKLVHILGIKARCAAAVASAPASASEASCEGDSSAAAPTSTPPVTVLVGPFEHHSNILPWRESGAFIVRVAEDPRTGLVDLKDLRAHLRATQRDPATTLVIGAFAAASNVTGVLTDVDAVTALLHEHGALAVWDYATAGPYVPIDMNPPSIINGKVTSVSLAKDAVVFSPHKFLGGVNTPGVLVVKKSLCRNPVPQEPGGGTVFFVTKDAHRFLSNRAEREEGGTPDIVGTVRAGLALQLKTTVGARNIFDEELRVARHCSVRLRGIPNLAVLGPRCRGGREANTGAMRLPIFSFLVRATGSGAPHEEQKFLHYNFVTRLLNDVFGVQARGGCACAGPYAQDLLGMTREMDGHDETTFVDAFERALLGKNELLRPGFTRISFPWVMTEEEVEYVCCAVEAVAENGWRMLPQYRYDHETGEWSHRSRLNKFPNRVWISRAFQEMAGMPVPNKSGRENASGGVVAASEMLARQLEAGRQLLLKETEAELVSASTSSERHVLDPKAEALRWFVLPSEVREGFNEHKEVAPAGSSSMVPSIVPREYDDAAGEKKGEVGCIAAGKMLKNAAQAKPIVLVPEQLLPAKVTRPAPEDSKEQPPKTPSAVPAEAADPILTKAPSIELHEKPASQASPSRKGPAGTVYTLSDLPKLRALLARPEYAGKKARAKRKRLKKQIAQLESSSAAGGAAASDVKESDDGEKVDAVTMKRDAKFAKRVVNEDRLVSNNNFETSSSSAIEEMKSAGIGDVQAAPSVSAKKALKVCKRKLMTGMGRAVSDWGMIREGDRVMVGVSGGKDSLSLLHLLLELKRRAPINFEVGAVTIDPGTEAFDPRPLIPYIRDTLGVPYYYEEDDKIFLWAEYKNPSSICSFCARMKRGAIYAACRREGYNVLALGQHLDDLAESFLMGAFLNGELRAMKACYETKEGVEQDQSPVNASLPHVGLSAEGQTPQNASAPSACYYAGSIRVIRPLVYVREHLTGEFARRSRLPVINENCPACFEAPQERRRVKKLLSQQESLFPATFQNLRRAMIPLMGPDTTRNLADYAAEKLSAGRRYWDPDRKD